MVDLPCFLSRIDRAGFVGLQPVQSLRALCQEGTANYVAHLERQHLNDTELFREKDLPFNFAVYVCVYVCLIY